jgi:hypothetical protein
LHHRYLDEVAERERAFSFESPTPLQSRMPRVDEVIEVATAMLIHIVDFQVTGELRRRESPAGRSHTQTDRTGISFPIGTRLTIREIAFEGPPKGQPNGPTGVWLRVTPG